MSLQWVICGWLAAALALLLLFVSLPSTHGIRATLIPLVQRLLQPLLAVVPFALFQLLDVYWKYEHSPSCERQGLCTSADRDRYEKSIIRNQRNFLLSVGALFLYWLLYRFVTIHGHILRMEGQIKKLKDA